MHAHFHGYGGVTARRKGNTTIPASYQLPKIHPTHRPLICIINALIAPRGHRRVSVKRVAFQFASGATLSCRATKAIVTRDDTADASRFGKRSLIEHRGLKSAASRATTATAAAAPNAPRENRSKSRFSRASIAPGENLRIDQVSRNVKPEFFDCWSCRAYVGQVILSFEEQRRVLFFASFEICIY